MNLNVDRLTVGNVGKDDLVIMLLFNNYITVVLSLKVTDVMLLVRVT